MKIRTLSAPLSLSVALSTAAAPGGHAEIIDRIVAHVDGEIVTQTDVVRFLPIYVEVYGIGPSAFATRDGCQRLVDDVLDFLVTSKILARRAEARDLEVTGDEVGTYVAEQYGRMRLSEAQFEAQLRESGIEYLDFREFIELNLNRTRMLQIDVAARVAISDGDVDRVMSERYPDGVVARRLTTSHLFVQVPPGDPAADAAARTAIEARAARLAGGEPFGSVAADNDDGTRRTGGAIGAFLATELDPEYVRAALALDVGGVSAPVRSGFGYHIIRLDALEREEGADVGAIRDGIRFELQNAETENQQRLYLERVRDAAYISIDVPEFGYCAGLPG